MDQSTSLVSKGVGASLRLAGAFAIVLLALHSSSATEKPAWSKSLRRKLAQMDRAHPGRFGLYVKDLETREEFSHRGDETWYIASGVKVPVAIEVLRQVELGRLRLEDRVRLGADDYVDGAGGTNAHPAGSSLSVRYLLEQMLIHSDNTASDLLIREVGLERINRLVSEHVPRGFGPITRLSDVRRQIYSGIDSRAMRLKGREFLLLKASRTDEMRVRLLGELIGRDSVGVSSMDLEKAYSRYYASGLNSATLRAYGMLLEKVWEGRILGAASRSFLMNLMERAETGKKRVKADLAPSWVFAHKTGTQRRRICDFGIVRDEERPSRKPIVVSACTEGDSKVQEAEAVLRAVGKAMVDSGVFESPN